MASRFFSLLALLLASCAPLESPPPPAAPAATPMAVAAAYRVDEKNELLEFAYAWSAEAAAVDALAKRFAAQRDRDRAAATAAAKEDRDGRPPEAPFLRHYFSKVWETYGQCARLLSLAAKTDTFIGGAHGDSSFSGIIWDRALGREIKLAGLFRDRDRALAALTKAYCAALNEERAKRRGEPVPAEGEDWLVACPPLAGQVALPLDRDDGIFESFIILLPPYEAGSYAEGPYEIEIPVTDEIRNLVRAEYAGAF